MGFRTILFLIGFLSYPFIQTVAQSMIPKSYIAYHISDSLDIDGMARERSWELAAWSDDFTDIQGDTTPIYNTRLKMLWDVENLYVYVQMEEPHIWGTLKQRDTVIFYNNDFEIFMDPDGDTHNYMEIEINALNTIWDLFLTKPYREGGRVLNDWDLKGLQSAVSFQGTLNDPSDRDTSWSIELAIPWRSLQKAGGLPPENNFWRINFSRVQWQFDLIDQKYSRKKDARGEYLPEYNWVWSPQGVINMHEPEHWGYVFFSSNSIEQQNDHFEIPKDEEIKWKMYSLYRAQKAYYREHQKWATAIEKLQTAALLVDGKLLNPKLEVHHSGWNISIKSPFTSELLIIREDGDFKKQRQ